MRRGDVYWVDFNPALGSEADKIRPAVIVSNDAANQTVERTGRGVVTVVPMTSNVEWVYPFQVLLPASETGLTTDSKAQSEQIRAVSPQRFRQRVGTLSTMRLAALEKALRTHLVL